MKVIYPGSFNPWTIGHQDIYERAMKIFGNVTVVVAVNPNKNVDPGFIRWTLKPLQMDVVVTHDLVAIDADIIIRGVRSGDWEYEQNLAQWNRELDAETIFLCPSPELSHISSSGVRALSDYAGALAMKKVPNPDVYERWKLGCIDLNYGS